MGVEDVKGREVPAARAAAMLELVRDRLFCIVYYTNGATTLYNYAYPAASSASWIRGATLKSISPPGTNLDPDTDTSSRATEYSFSVSRNLNNPLVPTQDIGPFFAGVLLPDIHLFPPKRC